MSDGEDITVTTGHQNGKRRVVTVDQEWPLFTVDGNAPAAKAAPAGDQTPNVTAVLRDVLGWRPIPQDPKAFVAALTASFELTDVQGHVESRYRARGFSMQADLGAVSGGQASLYARAKAGLTHMLELLDGLTPLRPDFDVEDGAAVRALVRTELNRIVAEVGMTGGPRSALVDSSFVVVLGIDTSDADASEFDDVTGDTVGGQLGRLRDVFGLVDEHVNTIEEERVRTSYWTLVDEVLDLARAWAIWSKVLAGGTTGGFLGTDLVLLSRLMEAASEQVDEYEEILDSVLIGGADRQTIWLDAARGLTLQGLIDWTRQFLRVDGPAYLNDSGRDGLESAFLPTVERLEQVYLDVLVDPLATNPAGFPPGLSAARSVVALTSLVDVIHQLTQTTEDSVPDTTPEPLEVTIWPLQEDGSEYFSPARGDVRIPRQPRPPVVPQAAVAEALRREAEARQEADEKHRLYEQLTAEHQGLERILAEIHPGQTVDGARQALASAREELTRAQDRKAGQAELSRHEQTAGLAAMQYAEFAKLEDLRQRVQQAAADEQAARDGLQAAAEERRRLAAQQLEATPERRFLVSVRIAALRARLLPAFVDGSQVVLPDPGSDTTNDDTVSAVFAVTDQSSAVWSLLDNDEELVFAPDQVPLVLLDAATGERVWPVGSQPPTSWPAGPPAIWTQVTPSGVTLPSWQRQSKYRNAF
jgi:hypothetical protein